MRSTVFSVCFVDVIVGTGLAELEVQIKINATLKCEAHKSCHDEMQAMFIYTSWRPKVLLGDYPPAPVLHTLDANETTHHVEYDENLYGGDSYFLQVDHVCPCSNVTSGNASKSTLDPLITLCVDLEDKLKGLPQKDGRAYLAFDFGEVDLSAPWKYYRCPDVPAPCSP